MSFRLKKYLFLPIFLICLFLALNVGGADLFGTYDQRIKLTIDSAKIDGDLAWFAVTVFLTSTQGEEVFVEFDADADFLKVAFTKSDGTTELYAECELFDDSAEKAIYHVSRDGWAITSGADTDFYMYYDDDAGDNNTYIGAITARTEVWDGNFDCVYHMVDDNGNVDDSTSNSNDGTKIGAGEPSEATGKVGQAQDFDGSNDYITKSPAAFLEDPGTIEILFNADSINTNGTNVNMRMTALQYSDIYAGIQFDSTDNKIQHLVYDGSFHAWKNDTAITADGSTWYYLAFVEETSGNGSEIFLNGVADGDHATETWQDNTAGSGGYLRIGGYVGGDTTADSFNGKIDEVRISSTQRNAAWINGTYNSLWDTLLTYGSEEAAPVGITWNTKTITKWNTKTITIPINTQ